MSTALRGALGAALLSVGSAVGSLAQQAPADSSQAARGFVESFYQWYVPAAGANRGGPAYVVALKEKRAAFSPALYQALKADRDAQARVAGEIVGLDSDPFLNSQDLCDGFEVGGVVRYRDTYRVQVFAVCEGKRPERPSALADVRATGGHWEFVNFYDADGKNDLLATLKALAAERRKAASPAQQSPIDSTRHRPTLLARFPAEVHAAESGAALRTCVDASGVRQARSGDFVAGSFDLYPANWRRGFGKLSWRPRVVIPGETLLVRATPLEHQSTVQEYRFSTIAHVDPRDHKPFYPSDIPLPRAGAWLLVANVGQNWGCFLLVV